MRIEINSPHIKQKDLENFINLPVVVKVIGEFNEDSAKSLYSDCDNALKTGQKILPIFIDSYGGWVDSLVGMLDYFQALRDNNVQIVTIACGKAMSCGALLFAMGDKRYIGKRSRIMFHRVSGGSLGNPDDIKVDAKEIERLEKFIFEEVSKNIGKPKGWLFDQLKKNNFSDWYLNADSAIESKVATNIGIPQFTFSIDTHFGYE
jgi:ATP-dependent Clp endopeptidase proteolytic subunit ClpP